MFSRDEKMKIAKAVEDVIREINHPEMDNDNIKFNLHIEGKETWSWADIRPNKKDEPPADPNNWNEKAQTLTKNKSLPSM